MLYVIIYYFIFYFLFFIIYIYIYIYYISLYNLLIINHIKNITIHIMKMLTLIFKICLYFYSRI